MSVAQEDIYEAQATYQAFKLVEPSWAQYSSNETLEAENMEVLVNFGRENLTGGLKAFALLGAWQISFRECLKLGTLEADENHPRHPARVAAQNHARNAQAEAIAFRTRVQGMSSTGIKEAASKEPGFLQQYEALVKSERVRR